MKHVSTNALSLIGLLLSAPAVVLWILIWSRIGEGGATRLWADSAPDAWRQPVEIVLLLLFPLATAILGAIALRRAINEDSPARSLEQVTVATGVILVLIALAAAFFRPS